MFNTGEVSPDHRRYSWHWIEDWIVGCGMYRS